MQIASAGRIPFLLAMATVGAMASEVQAQTSSIVEPMNLASIVQVAGGLIVVLLLLAACLYGMRRFTGMRSPSGKLLNIVDAISIGPRDRIMLLEVDGRRVLLGISPGRIQALLDLQGSSAQPFDKQLEDSVRSLREAN